MSVSRDLVLGHDNIVRKLDRIAREILEVHYRESRMHVLGISGQGVAVSQALARRQRALSDIDILTGTLSVNKEAPLEGEMTCDVELDSFQDAIVIVVDDVLNSGRTLIHSVAHVLHGKPREVHTAVLVDRKHRSFPIRADYCGLTLSTHLNEHIAVDLSNPDAATVHVERTA